jgi:hypothetical protein
MSSTTSSAESGPDVILIERLCEFYDPFGILGIGVEDCESATPERFYADFQFRNRNYHCRRAAYFRNEIKAGAILPPIEMDNYCAGYYILPEPIVIDGHHRLCGAILAGAATIRASYSGRVDVLRYLTGASRRRPRE